MAKFSYLRESLSFLDGGNAPFIGLLFLIGELKQVNSSIVSCTFGALRIWYQSQVEGRVKNCRVRMVVVRGLSYTARVILGV